VGVEDLDAVVFAVAHVHGAVRIDGYRMHGVELTRPGTGRAPGRYELAVVGELHHAGIAVPVADVDGAAVGTEGDVGGTVERLLVGRGFALDPEGELEFAQVIEAERLVINSVGDPDLPIPVDAHAVRAAEQALAPRAKKLALGVEDDNRVGLRSAVEHVDL